MSHFRIHFQRRGGHTHLTVFAGKRENMTHGCCGDLCMTNEEFADFQELVKQADIQFLDRDEYASENSQFGVGA